MILAKFIPIIELRFPSFLLIIGVQEESLFVYWERIILLALKSKILLQLKDKLSSEYCKINISSFINEFTLILESISKKLLISSVSKISIHV